jgi:hypothetical protein
MMLSHDKLRALGRRILERFPLIPAQAGIRSIFCSALGPGFRRDARVKATPQQPGDTQWLA